MFFGIFCFFQTNTKETKISAKFPVSFEFNGDLVVLLFENQRLQFYLSTLDFKKAKEDEKKHRFKPKRYQHKWASEKKSGRFVFCTDKSLKIHIAFRILINISIAFEIDDFHR